MKKSVPNQPRAKKSLGQNFLTDSNYIAKIVAAVDASPGDTVIEIGPGRGALTEKLVDSGSDVIAIELDRNLIAPLREKFNDRGSFSVIEGDALTVDFKSLIDQEKERLALPKSQISDLKSEVQDLRTQIPRPVKLVANLPYYISTAILQRLAEQRESFDTLVLMFQREVADRITAAPGSSDRGFLTVLTESAFVVRRLFDVPPDAFRPVPKVWSSVVRLTPKAGHAADEPAFRQFLSIAFAQKRKTIGNNLKPAYPDFRNPLIEAGIDEKRRAESLTLGEWHRLFAAVVS